MILKANAKINLTLNIVGEKGGFHMLESIVCPISTADKLSVVKSEKTIVRYKRNAIDIPMEQDNAYKACEAFSAKFNCGKAKITIDKRIPEKAGLGGSSADSVAVVKAMQKLYNITDENAVKELVISLGSDCLCQYQNTACLMTGRGEKAEKISCLKKLHFAVCVPSGGVNTKLCYELYDNLPKSGVADNLAVCSFLNGQTKQLKLGNCLYAPACQINEQVNGAYNLIKQTPCIAVNMSGSGSAVYGVYKSAKLAKQAVKILKEHFKTCFYACSVKKNKSI